MMLLLRTIITAFILGTLSFAPATWAQEKISVQDAFAMAEAGEVTLVDIRTPREWKQTGVASLAETINVYDEAFLGDLMTLLEGDPTKPVAFICAVGGRSGQLSSILADRGFTQVFDVTEGMKGSGAGPGWIKAGLPVVDYN